MVRVVELNCYPIKGCAAMRLPDAALTPAGLRHDRSFMVTDRDGVFRTQRKDPLLARVRPQLSADGTRLTLRCAGIEPLSIPVISDGPRLPVVLFGAPYLGLDQGAAVGDWFGAVLGQACRLVLVPPEHDRVTAGWQPGTAGYADGGALLLTSLTALDQLNDRIVTRGAEPVPMDRFRANIVVDGWAHDPCAEDEMRRFAVGAAELGYAKLAIRCAVVLVDQDAGRRDGPEPLRSLAEYRRARGGGVAFGVKFSATRCGKLSVGDALTVTEWGTSEL